MYLVAIKSIYSKVGEGSICVINDGTLKPNSIELLKWHLASPRVVDVETVDTGICPRGGTWERLLYLLDLTEDAYVIQVDSDLLALQPIPEVLECYRENRSFTLGTWAGQEFTDLATAAAYANSIDSDHVQVIAERVLDRLGNNKTSRYVRGCSGFAGFARGPSARRHAEIFSRSMQEMIGDRWSNWGSEQITSCFIVANSDQSRVLPWPKYSNFNPETKIPDAALLHFIGDWRFYRGHYLRESRRAIAALTTSRGADSVS